MTPRRLIRRAVTGVVLMTAAVLPWIAATPAAADPRDEPGTLAVQTVPVTKGARVAADGNVVRTNARGLAELPVPNFRGLAERLNLPSTRVGPKTRVSLDRVLGDPSHGVGGEPVIVGLNTERLVSWTFTSRTGREVSSRNVRLLELKSNTGQIVTLKGKDVRRPTWLAASRTQQTPDGLVSKDLYWTVSRAVVEGADVVNRGQQKFFPTQSVRWNIDLLFFRVEFVGRDLLFGTHAGVGVEMTGPDGETRRIPFVNGMASVNSLPRGTYEVRVYGSGVSFTRPMSVSKDQIAEIEVITDVDLVLIAGVIGMTAVSLVLVGRRHHLVTFGRRLARVPLVPRRRLTKVALAAVVLVVTVLVGVLRPGAANASESDAVDAPPTFAYYYIWFHPSSWLRAKTDYPLLGRYSSDDRVAMSRHIDMAKQAGLTGFLVSWKDTAHLSHRLAILAELASKRDFELGIVYQGLDFYRNTLPPDQIAEDLEAFAERYGSHPAFDSFGKPVVVITGTEDYDVAELEQMTARTDDLLHVLASAKSPEEYRRTASVMDGDAYYWSSADPRTDWYRDRLADIAKEVRADRGLWFAPAVAGFDARQLGGERVVPRAGGATLEAAMESARTTDPDAVAVISWNEFSENSHIEPSQNYGTQELEALARVLGGSATVPTALDSVESPRDEPTGLTGWGALVALLFLGAVLNLVLAYRRGRDDEEGPPGTGGTTGGQPPAPPRHRATNGDTHVTAGAPLLLKNLPTRGRRP